MPTPNYEPPSSILILGSGVFGLSTAYALTQNPNFSQTTITVLDRSPFPSPDGSSIDTSRIIRPDYKDPAYAALAAQAQNQWRQQGSDELGGQGRYSESGLCLVADEGKQGMGYVEASLENVKVLHEQDGHVDGLKVLESKEEIEQFLGFGGGSGNWGYINFRSGWADAEAAMRWLRKRAEATSRINFRVGEVEKLATAVDGRTVHGAVCNDGTIITADLTIVATGAWTPKLIDLRGRAQSTGQVLCYLRITDEEQERFLKLPVLLNLSNGLFIIPPKDNILKVARHAYGYSNPVSIPSPSDPSQTIEVSVPRTGVDDPTQQAPQEGILACQDFLYAVLPELRGRQFYNSRICWYTDTPKADFIISYHPQYKGLFMATGGSGHGFKFLPVIGNKIVDCVLGSCPEEFREKWIWQKDMVATVVTEDGSRGGQPGMILEVEFAKSML